MDKGKSAVIMGALLREIGIFMQRAHAEELYPELLSYIERFPMDGAVDGSIAYFAYLLEKVLPEQARDDAVMRVVLDACYWEDRDRDKEGIYWRAERLSMGTSVRQENPQKTDGKDSGLHSIFDSIETSFTIRNRDGAFTPRWYYPLSKLDLARNLQELQGPEGIFPLHIPKTPSGENSEAGGNERKTCRGLWESFYHEFRQLHPFFAWDSRSYFNEVYYLLQKYTWSIPAVLGGTEDISLFDRMKTTAAVVGCLIDGQRERADEDKGFLLWGADLSGIQPFIFRITRGLGSGGISKRLRGRSFYLMMLMEVLARHLLQQLDLPLANINFCGGGNIELLLPRTTKVSETLDAFEKQAAQWLRQSFSGQLALVTGRVPMSAEELQTDFASKKVQLQDVIGTNKRQKFSGSFNDPGFWVEASKSSYQPIRICPSCSLAVIHEAEWDICTDCMGHKMIGQRLPQAKYVAFAPEMLSGKPFDTSAYCRFGPFGYVYLLEEADLRLYVSHACCHEIVSTDPKAAGVKGFYFLSNILPTASRSMLLDTERDSDGESDDEGSVYPNQTLSFTTLADMARGDQRIGMLKMDVDNLSLIFSLGLELAGSPGEMPTRSRSLSRISALSREISYFFNGLIGVACQEISNRWKRGNEESDWGSRVGYSNEDVSGIFYVVFSGGDDLFVIGPWDRIIELAGLLRSVFKDFTCHNPNLTISAGIFNCKAKYPISLAAQKAEEALEHAKEKGRNRLTLFGESVVWDHEDPRRSRVFDESVAEHSGQFFERYEIWTEHIYRSDQAKRVSVDSVPFSRLSRMEKTFLDLFGSQMMPRSFVHRLLKAKHQFFPVRYQLEHEREEEDHNWMLLPHLFYLTRRNLNETAALAIHSELLASGDAVSLMRQMKIPATMFLLKTRRQ